MAVNLTAAVAAFMAVLGVMFNGSLRLPGAVAAFAALPLVLILTYQLLLGATMVRRADSARLLEDRLFEAAALRGVEREAVGTRVSDYVEDIRTIRADTARPLAVRAAEFVIAAFPAVGWYITAAGLTLYVAAHPFGPPRLPIGTTETDPGAGGYVFVARLLYSILWALLIVTAIYYFTPAGHIGMWKGTGSLAARSTAPTRATGSRDQAADAAHIASARAPGDRASRIAALAQLHWSDVQGNLASTAAGVTLIASSVAYVGILATSYRADSHVPVLMYSALMVPVLVLQAEHMTLTARVMRRARSAALLERRLGEFANLDAAELERVGAHQSEAILDFREVGRAMGDVRVLKYARLASVLSPYVGWYLIGLWLTGYNIYSASQNYLAGPASKTSGDALVIYAFGALYAAFWMAFTISAGHYFFKSIPLEGGRSSQGGVRPKNGGRSRSRVSQVPLRQNSRIARGGRRPMRP
jgi:hypothetical protein